MARLAAPALGRLPAAYPMGYGGRYGKANPMSKQTASAAAADATAAFIASGRAVTKLPAGKARAPATEPDDDAIAAAATAAAASAAHAEAPAATPAPATADYLDEYGPVVAPAATPAPADWRDEYGPVVAPAATPAAASGVKGWAKAGATYHADDAVIEYVAPCPKKPGSQTYARYNAAYAVGRTIAQAKALGATAGDILWDLPRGFIRVRAPSA